MTTTTAETTTTGEKSPFTLAGTTLETGRALYEADCKARPTYHDGTPRKNWEQLGKVEKMSWMIQP
jgi:hypothetical protein